MKRILAAILTAAVAFTCITAPVQKANAANNGDKYTDSRGEYTYKDGYWEQQYGTDEEYGYTKMTLYEQKGDSMWNIGCAWYGKDGTLLFKLVDGEVILDTREGRGNAYIDSMGHEFVYKDGYCQWCTGTSDGYTKMELYDTKEEDMYDGFTPGFSIGEMWYDKDGNIVYKKVNDEVLVDKRKVEAYIVCRTQEKETLRVVAGLSINVFCSTDEESTAGNIQAEWSSSDNSIAVIDNDGKITGKKAGEVTITATIKKNGQKVTKKVEVVKNQYKETKDYGYCKTTKTAWYDAKGNLKCRMVCKSKAKPDKEFKTELCSTVMMGKKVLKEFDIDATNIKKNKTKTKTYTIKNVKFVDLTKSKNFRWETFMFTTNRF